MKAGAIYYTSNRIKKEIQNGCIEQISKCFNKEIISVSLNSPINFGKNIVYSGSIGAISMFNQILLALKSSSADYVFYLEHDILYHPSHFKFEPPRDDTFYYNVNVWRWDYYSKKIITYDHHASVSGLCVNRELALEFYKHRLQIIEEKGYDHIPTFGNPDWARSMGYEPGKFNKEGEAAMKEEWRSEFPNIDIRHTRSMTHPKLNYEDFKRKPSGWCEDVIENLPGWYEPWTLVQP